MPATALGVKTINRQAVLNDPTPSAMDNVNGNSFANGGKLFLKVIAPVAGGTVSVAFADKQDGQVVTPKLYTFTASQVGWIGPWPVQQYGATLVATASVTGFTCIPFTLG